VDPRAYGAEIEAWRERRLARLTAPDGWLSVIGLHFLDDGENRIGSGSPATVPVPAGRTTGDAGSIVVSRGVATWLGPAGAVELAPDLEGERPFWTDGGVSLSLIRRDGRFAVRVRDREAAGRSSPPRIPRFPIDPSWRLPARFEPYDPPRRDPVASVRGTADSEVFPGAVVFSRGGDEHRLEVIAERGETDLWIVFGDATNGRETYGGGRFVYAPPAADGHTVVDFNKAYNPPCVFSPYSTCPLPLPQNRLRIRVEAGEQLPDSAG